MPRPEMPLACSFCGKSKDEVKKLIAGPRIYICDGCVFAANDLLRAPPPTTDPMEADRILRRFEAGETILRQPQLSPAKRQRVIDAAAETGRWIREKR